MSQNREKIYNFIIALALLVIFIIYANIILNPKTESNSELGNSSCNDSDSYNKTHSISKPNVKLTKHNDETMVNLMNDIIQQQMYIHKKMTIYYEKIKKYQRTIRLMNKIQNISEKNYKKYMRNYNISCIILRDNNIFIHREDIYNMLSIKNKSPQNSQNYESIRTICAISLNKKQQSIIFPSKNHQKNTQIEQDDQDNINENSEIISRQEQILDSILYTFSECINNSGLFISREINNYFLSIHNLKNKLQKYREIYELY
jgi:hypothetical protein